MSWTAVCRLAELDEESAQRFDAGGRSFAIYRMTGDEVFCTDGFCTHEAIHLSDGLVMDYEVECPKHSSVFDLRTGEVMTPPACENLNTYPARVSAGMIEIDI